MNHLAIWCGRIGGKPGELPDISHTVASRAAAG